MIKKMKRKMKLFTTLSITMSVLLILTMTGCGKQKLEQEAYSANDTSKETQKEAVQTEKTEATQTEKASGSEKTGKTESVYPLTIKDKHGADILVEKEPKRIVSLGPNITETIFALGMEEKLVGRTTFCDYPEAASGIETIGSLYDINFETLAALEPDLVIASTHFTEENEAKLKDIGITTLNLYAEESFEGTYDLIESIGLALNAQDQAGEIIENMKSQVEAVVKTIENRERPTVYYVVGFGQYGEYTATGETFMAKILDMAGGENIAKDAEGWAYSLEKIVEKNPQIVICSDNEEIMNPLKEQNGYKDLEAFKNGNLKGIDENLVVRQGPRLAEGLEALARIIHPEAF